MKIPLSLFPAAFLATLCVLALTPRGRAGAVDPDDRAFRLASRFTALGYYVTPFHESRGGNDTKCELTVPVSNGLEYVFVVAGDGNSVNLDVWVEAEAKGNAFGSDSHYRRTGLGGVRWRAQHDGEVHLVIHFAKASSRSNWNAILARRSLPPAESAVPAIAIEPTVPGRRVTPAAAQAGK